MQYVYVQRSNNETISGNVRWFKKNISHITFSNSEIFFYKNVLLFLLIILPTKLETGLRYVLLFIAAHYCIYKYIWYLIKESPSTSSTYVHALHSWVQGSWSWPLPATLSHMFCNGFKLLSLWVQMVKSISMKNLNFELLYQYNFDDLGGPAVSIKRFPVPFPVG